MNTWDRLLAWEERHRLVVDSVTAGVLVLLVAPMTALVTSATEVLFGVWNSRSSGSLLAVLLIGPLALRRVRPTLSVALVYAVALVQMVAVTPITLPADLAVLVALYSVTVHGPRWAHRVAAVGAAAGSLLLSGLLARTSSLDASTAAAFGLFTFVLSLAAWAFGLVRRSRRETIEALVDRAERLETERDQQSRLATAAERARIAREMHDIVAHSLTVMIAQADGGRYAADADPPAATRALGTIAETGRAALTDMRRLLGVLRDEPRSSGGPRVGTTTPQPAADDLDALVEQVRSSGARVSMVRMGSARTLPPGVGLTVYRITQEALTNVLKHAGPDPAVTVMVQWRPDGITVEVTDDGRGAAAGSDGLGQGLRGMAERATMFGGSVVAGPRPGGGFRVRAHIPTVGEPVATTAVQDPVTETLVVDRSGTTTDQQETV